MCFSSSRSRRTAVGSAHGTRKIDLLVLRPARLAARCGGAGTWISCRAYPAPRRSALEVTSGRCARRGRSSRVSRVRQEMRRHCRWLCRRKPDTTSLRAGGRSESQTHARTLSLMGARTDVMQNWTQRTPIAEGEAGRQDRKAAYQLAGREKRDAPAVIRHTGDLQSPGRCDAGRDLDNARTGWRDSCRPFRAG